MRRIEVLAVEDNPPDLFWLKGVLNETGVEHRLSVVDDGKRALSYLLKKGEYAEAPTPDLILLDVHLPLLSGFEVLREVPDADKLPICVLTSSNAERDLFAKEFGIHGVRYLIKPVTRENLLKCFQCYDHLRPIAEELAST